MKRSKVNKEKCKIYSLRRKSTPVNRVELGPVFKGIKSFKESLMLNRINGVVTSG